MITLKTPKIENAGRYHEAFPGVTMAIHYSRFNMRVKMETCPAKFHVIFPIDRMTDAALYSDMKKVD